MTHVAFDVEGTLTTGETWKGMAAWMQAHGRSAQYQAFFYRNLPAAVAARLGFGDRRAFQDRFMEGAAGLLKGLTQGELEAVGEWVATNELWPKRREDVLAELRACLAAGERVVLCSATFQPVLEAFARRVGQGVRQTHTGGAGNLEGVRTAHTGGAGNLEGVRTAHTGGAGNLEGVVALGTPLQMANGVFTGRVVGAVRSGAAKAEGLREFLAGQPLRAAYGDTLPDAAMLELSQSPVAVYPDAKLRELARARGWRVIG